MEHFLLILLDFLLLFPFQQVLSHGNGAPTNRCESMEPGHWVSPQESIPPFQILIDKTVIFPGDRVNITLTTVEGQPGFKGFLIMVKDADEVSSGGSKRNYGMFDLASSDLKNAQAVHCFDVRNSAMTHITNDVKNSVQLYWIAPYLEENQGQASSGKERELKVVATFVKDFRTIWTNVEPSEEERLLLQPKQQFSHPKFQQSKPDNKNEFLFRGDQIPTAQGTSSNFRIDGSSSWDHFKRAWNYVYSMFFQQHLKAFHCVIGILC